MPLYTYRCEAGHVSSRLCQYEDRPASVACEECGGPAPFAPFAPSPVLRAVDEARREEEVAASRAARPFVWREVACLSEACAHVTMEDIDLEPGRDPESAAIPCEKCGGETVVRGIHAIDRFGERFPYYDRGLGRWLMSKQHRLDVCRELGVVPIDGDLDIRGWAQKDRARAEVLEREVAEIRDMMEHSEHFAGYRRDRDRRGGQAAR